MKIIKERTRLLFSGFTDLEKKRLDDLVGTDNNVFSYDDPDKGLVGFPPGMEQSVRRMFPNAQWVDQSQWAWKAEPITPVPLNIGPRNQMQVDCIDMILESAKTGKKVAAIVPPGGGKALPVDIKIPTPTGWKLMKDIQVGDLVIGRNGAPTKVLGVYPQGVRDLYRITFNDGREIECDLDHLWGVYTSNTEELHRSSTREMLNDYKETQYRIPLLTGSVQYQQRIVRTPPYIMGMKIRDSSEEIYIPDEYLYNDPPSRMELLRGLLDENGSPTMDATFTYTTNHTHLLYQVQELARGLGYLTNINGTRVEIRVPNPSDHLLIKDIRFSRKAEAKCIYVDAPDHLYVAGDFIVTHNTFMACYSAIKVGLRTLFIAPTSAIKQQWADTLTGMFGVDPTKVLLVTNPRQFVNVKADFVIVSQASLAVLNKTFDLEAIMRSNHFGTKVIDEVQMWFHNIIRVDANCNIKNNWYLTGTFGRSGQEENRIYQEMFGDLNIFTVPNKKGNIFNPRPGDIYGQKPHMNVRMIWARSHLKKGEIAAISNTMRYAERAGKWQRYGISIPAYAKLIVPEDGTMTPMLRTILRVCKMADQQVKYGTMLVLGNTINEAEVVAMHLRRMFPQYTIGTYHSHNDKLTNTKNKETCDILVSTIASAGTGFDWKGLAKLVQFASYASWILSDQCSGRLRRRDDGQDTWMWDIVDSDVNQLRAWANTRADVYKRKCKTFKVIDM